MIVVPPLTITSAMITAQFVPEPDTNNGEAAWNSGTTYNIGDVVCSTTTHRLYSSLIASNLNHALPTVAGTSNTQWLDAGPTNAYAMFDYSRNTQSKSHVFNPAWTIFPGVRVDTASVFNITDADTIRLQISNGTSFIYDVSETLFSRIVGNWYDYFYKNFKYKKAVLFTDIPQNLGYSFVFTSTGINHPKIGACVLGQSIYLGETQYDPTLSQINYSVITADNFGNTVLVPRRSVPNNTVTTQIPALNVDDALAARDALNATPALWSGLDDDTQPYFGSLLLIGVYTQFDIDPFSVDYATVTLQLQGF
jgi:hypothetical protein